MCSRLNLFSATKNSNVSFTLPITCQICLGKVKDPSVCPNLHAFCSSCIDLWLEKTKQCPTCRVHIDKENPCRRILGGIDNQDDVDLIKPTEFSQPATRKARFLNFFEQYEDEISRLNSFIDSLTDEVTKLKDCIKSPISNSLLPNDDYNSLNKKLEETEKKLAKMSDERDHFKELNTKIESQNSMLIQDIACLKATLNEKNSQMTNKYTMAAMESKIENYEKEIKRLQKALEKSDKYIAELESMKDLKGKENKINCSKSELNLNNSTSSFSFVKPPSPKETNSDHLSQISPLNDPPSAKKNIIPKNNFYGSPSKTPTRQTQIAQSNTQNISSFGDRLKKNLFNTPAPSFASNFNLVSNHPCPIISSNQSAVSSSSNQTSSNNLLFSPMKRLRLEENGVQMTDNLSQQISVANNLIINNNESQPSSSSFLNTVSIINESMQLIEDPMIQTYNTNTISNL